MSAILDPDIVVHARYRIVRLIGQGGMGAVYAATDQTFGSQVALKQMFLNPNLNPQQVTDLERAFQREAYMLHQLRHPALPRVSDYFLDTSGWFLVMDYIEGEDLAAVLEQHLRKHGCPLAASDVITWGIQVLSALEYLHSQTPPIIHRDIKPHNIKLTARGEIFLIDFGIAKGAATQTTAGGYSSVYAYTPTYAPLEQVQGTGTEPRSDLFSLGATLYHLLTGRALDQPPRCDALTRAAAVVGGRPDPLTPPPGVHPAVNAVLMQALALAADHRPATATAMRQALEAAFNQPAYTETTIIQPSNAHSPTAMSATSPARPTHPKQVIAAPRIAPPPAHPSQQVVPVPLEVPAPMNPSSRLTFRPSWLIALLIVLIGLGAGAMAGNALGGIVGMFTVTAPANPSSAPVAMVAATSTPIRTPTDQPTSPPAPSPTRLPTRTPIPSPTRPPTRTPTAIPLPLPPPPIVSRSAWGAAPATGSNGSQRPRKISLNHDGQVVGTDEDVVAIIRDIQAYHQSTWYDIAWHYVIDPYGNIYAGHAVTDRGDTNYHYDTDGIVAIGVLGNYDEQIPSSQQINAIVNLMAWLCDTYSISPDEIYPHSYFANLSPLTDPPISSPGYNFDMDAIRAAVVERLRER